MANKEKIKVSIMGGSGYAGGEVLRILLNHPNVEIGQLSSRKFARFPVTIAHPNLRGRTDLKFSKPENFEKCDVLILALPNGDSQKNIEHYFSLAPKVIDLGADFRLNSQETYEGWYGKHLKPEFISKFVYGIAEINREKIKSAQYVACGGCEATCSILTLYPLFKHKLVEENSTIIDVKIGSSATGGSPSVSTHHPERAGVVRSYKPTMHRHTAEIEQELSSAFGNKIQAHLSATAIEMVRGILVTCHVFLKEDVSEAELWRIYKDAYGDEPFIRLINDKAGIFRFPEPKLLSGTNFCDIGFEKDERSKRVVVVGAIDNLVKGTAGQAVQAMNLMSSFNEREALDFTGLHPI